MTLNRYKGPGDIEAEVIMTRQTHTGSFLILEGDDDYRFWLPRVAAGDCELVNGNGKPNVESALTRLDRRSFHGALGVVDDDFDSLQGRSCPSPNLIATDTHDLECLLLRSPSLERVLAEYGNTRKIQQFEKAHGCTVREALLARGLVFGRLRWLALREGWETSFDGFGPERFVDRATWQVSTDDLHAAVVAAETSISIESLCASLDALPAADPWRICQGHDLVSVLRIGLSKVLGNLKTSKGVNDIAALLRGSFDDSELHRGHLGRSIREWQKVNSPYRILRASR